MLKTGKRDLQGSAGSVRVRQRTPIQRVTQPHVLLQCEATMLLSAVCCAEGPGEPWLVFAPCDSLVSLEGSFTPSRLVGHTSLQSNLVGLQVTTPVAP